MQIRLIDYYLYVPIYIFIYNEYRYYEYQDAITINRCIYIIGGL